MLDAKDAKEITIDSINTYVNDIENGIKKNAALGKYSYEHVLGADEKLVDKVTYILRKAHYKVDTESTFGFDCVWRIRLLITWDK